MAKYKYYVTEVNYTQHKVKIVDIITMDSSFDYCYKYTRVFEVDNGLHKQTNEHIGYYASTDKHHKWVS